MWRSMPASQNFTFPSSLPETMVCPSGRKTALLTHISWPLKVVISFCVCTFHSLTVPSTQVVTSNWLSGEKATEVTVAVCPTNVATWVAVLRSHNLTSKSLLADAIAQVWRNLGNGTFAKIADLPGLFGAAVAVGDL